MAAGLVLRAGGTITFTHDRVQEAVYLSMPTATRAALHLQIGHLLMADKTPADIENAIFSIVSQFNRAAADATVEGDGRTADDKALLCRLNFLAGKKAKAAIAYATARSFLDRAFGLLPADAWQVSYADSFAISLALSECEYLVGHFQRAEELAVLILANVQSKRDRASVYRLRTQLYQMAGSYDDALATMSEAAGLFDVVFPADGPDMEAAIDAESQEIAGLLRGRRIDNRQLMTAFRRAHHLCRLVLLWFVLSLGVAVASPMVNPQAMELVCSTAGTIKLVVQTDEGAQVLGAASQMDCPLCVPGGAPPLSAMAADLPNLLPLSHAVQPTEAARIAAATAAPPPARGPPRFS